MKKALVLCTLLLVSPSLVAAEGGRFYLAGEFGFYFSRSATFLDENPNIKGATPLYGPGYGAAGGFGRFGSFGGGLGIRINKALAADFILAYHPSIEFSGESDFLPVGSPEPVRGTLNATTGLASLRLNFTGLTGWSLAGFEPVVGAGAGFSRNSNDEMVLAYPTLAVPHTLTTPAGRKTCLAWSGTAGISRPLGRKVRLEIEYRYVDFGKAVTDAGDAVRYRPTTKESKTIPIGATEARLRAQGICLRLKYSPF